MAEPPDVTQTLSRATRGDSAAAAELIPLVYERLRQLASGYLRGERPDHTLQPTALVHEAYLRLVDRSRVDWRGRTHFLGVAANEMRRLLVEHARRRGAKKRGGGSVRIALDRVLLPTGAEVDALDIGDALTTLSSLHERQAEVVVLRFFGGLTVEEVAEFLSVSVQTVERDWRLARAWLFRTLKEKREGDDPRGVREGR